MSRTTMSTLASDSTRQSSQSPTRLRSSAAAATGSSRLSNAPMDPALFAPALVAPPAASWPSASTPPNSAEQSRGRSSSRTRTGWTSNTNTTTTGQPTPSSQTYTADGLPPTGSLEPLTYRMAPHSSSSSSSVAPPADPHVATWMRDMQLPDSVHAPTHQRDHYGSPVPHAADYPPPGGSFVPHTTANPTPTVSDAWGSRTGKRTHEYGGEVDPDTKKSRREVFERLASNTAESSWSTHERAWVMEMLRTAQAAGADGSTVSERFHRVFRDNMQTENAAASKGVIVQLLYALFGDEPRVDRGASGVVVGAAGGGDHWQAMYSQLLRALQAIRFPEIKQPGSDTDLRDVRQFIERVEGGVAHVDTSDAIRILDE